MQEEYIKDETKNLKRELLRAQEEVRARISSKCTVFACIRPLVPASAHPGRGLTGAGDGR